MVDVENGDVLFPYKDGGPRFCNLFSFVPIVKETKDGKQNFTRKRT
jgi:hypothetical protein